MGGLIAFLTKNTLGKAVLNFLIKKVLESATKEFKKEIEDRILNKKLAALKKEREELNALTQKLASDGLTEEEKNEIRKKKIKLDQDTFNSGSSTPNNIL